jgi:hypothetical protein
MSMKIPGIPGSGIPQDFSLPRMEGSPGTEPRADVRPGRPPVASKAVPGDDLRRAADVLEQTFRLFNKRLKISVNEEIDRVVVKVIDGNTDKIIKEIPPEELQRLIARIKETIGLLFDQKI